MGRGRGVFIVKETMEYGRHIEENYLNTHGNDASVPELATQQHRLVRIWFSLRLVSCVVFQFNSISCISSNQARASDGWRKLMRVREIVHTLTRGAYRSPAYVPCLRRSGPSCSSSTLYLPCKECIVHMTRVCRTTLCAQC